MGQILYRYRRTSADGTVRCYLTLDCNLNCLYCSAEVPAVATDRKKGEIPPEIWAEGINRRNRSTILAGGEPFLYPYLPELVNMINPGIRVDIYSNLVADVSDFLSRAISKPRFLVSCHPMSEQLQMQWAENVRLLIDNGNFVRFHVVKAEGWQERLAFYRSLGYPNEVTLCTDQRAGPRYIKHRGENIRDNVTCRGRIFIYGPGGFRYSCVRLLGMGTPEGRLEHISEKDGEDWIERECRYFGRCTACDNAIEGEVTCE